MKRLIAFDLDGTLAESKQPLDDTMGEALADLLAVVDVAIISGGNDYPAKTLGLDTICVRDPRETLAVIASIVACLK